MAITTNDAKITVDAYMIFDKGYARMHGLRYNENNGFLSIIYDGIAIPYIHYQETGFTHWISGRRVEVNKNYISEDTTNALDFLVNSANMQEKSLIMASNKRTVQARNNQMSQGVLESIKGNKRSDGDVLIG